MLRLYIFCFIVFISCPVFSQNWNLINPSNKFNYTHTSQPYKVPVATIYTDSLRIINWDLYLYMNTRATVHEDFMMINQPRFLMKEMIIDTNGLVRLHDTVDYFIEKLKDVGESWVFDPVNNITAEVISINQQTFLDTVDMVKTVLLSSGDSLKMSQDFGLLSFPDFSQEGHYFELAGIENRIGLQNPDYIDLLTPEPESIYQYKWTSTSFSAVGYELTRISKHTLFRINNVYVSGDSIIISRDGLVRYVKRDETDTVFNFFYISGDVIYDGEMCMYYSGFLDSYNNQAINMCHTSIGQPGNLWKTSSIKYDTIYDRITKKTYPYYIYQYLGDDVLPLYMIPNYGLDMVEYLDGIGLKFYHSYKVDQLKVIIKEDTLLAYRSGPFQEGRFYPKPFYYPVDYEYYFPVLPDNEYIFKKENDTSFRLKLSIDCIESNMIDSIYYLKEEILSAHNRNQQLILGDTLNLYNDRVKFDGDYFYSLMHREIVGNWAFYEDNFPVASVVSIQEESIPGLTDTVKTISFFDGSGYEIKLSKYYGLLKYPDFSEPGNHYVRYIDQTSIKEFVSEINITPNPFSDHLVINGYHALGLSYELYYQDGSIVDEGMLSNRIETGNKNLHRGIYFLKITDSGNALVVKKLVKL